MKIEREKNRLVIDFAEAEEGKRGKFFYALSGIPFSEWISDTAVAYDTEAHPVEETTRHLLWLAKAAKNNGVPLSEEVTELVEVFRERLEKESLAKLEAERLEKEKSQARTRLRYGCSWCADVQWSKEQRWYVCGDNGQPCKTSAAETEMLYEQWKETRVFQRETPFPNQQCKYLEVLA